MVTVPGLPEFLEMRFNKLEEGVNAIAGLLHAAYKRVLSIVSGQVVRRDFFTCVDIEKVCGDAAALQTLFYLRKPREAAGLINALRRAAGGDPNLYFAVRPGYP